MEIFDNTHKTVKNDLLTTIKPNSKISIAAACFSIYAYKELKTQLENIEELRFIFTSPTFTTEKAPKDKKEFYIPRLNRERNLYGSEFEVKLRNELSQKSIAKECAEWIKKKVTFKSNKTSEHMMGFANIDNTSYSPINGFTTVELGSERGNSVYTAITKTDITENSRYYLKTFDEIWKDTERLEDVTNIVIDNITSAYKENSPEFLYFVTLYNIFNEFLEDISQDVLPNEDTGFKTSCIWNMLYNFQKDAALAIINKLEQFNGCILADSVGLGKTFTALAVIKYYESRNRSILVLCPKKLSNNWNTYKDNYVNNPIAKDRLRYDVLYHTDLNRDKGSSNGLDLSRLNWGNYDLVVIDESHNFRNGGNLLGTSKNSSNSTSDEDTFDISNEDIKFNRYATLINQVIRKGVKTKVLMLSATPVNNRFLDLKNQLAIAYEGNEANLNEKLKIGKPLSNIFKDAQTAFNTWSNFPSTDRTTDQLLKMLDFNFFELLDSVTIARSRKHIQKYYDTADIGTFPKRLKPISEQSPLTDIPNAINYNEIFEQLMLLELSIYTPTQFIHSSKMSKYEDLYNDNSVNIGFTQANREEGIRRLMAINLMKRMESSVHAFRLTIERIESLITKTISSIEHFKHVSCTENAIYDFENELQNDFDIDDSENDVFTFGKKVKVNLEDMDYESWQQSLEKDRETLGLIQSMVQDITPEHDSKLQRLLEVIRTKIQNPINPNNKKIIVFTAFADTAEYLYEHIHTKAKNHFGINTAMITGSIDGKTTIPKMPKDLNTVLTCFSPISKGKNVLMPNNTDSIDILIATDCISEGQNLQDCDYLINYDIHWNPVRIIQRFGRIDRIGSKNAQIQLVNFWPDITLDEYIDLKNRVETRMKIVNMTATGDENIIAEDEKTDLEYRKAQLQKLKEEVVDIEDMSTGISIMDLGLNEFRLDLLEYVKNNPSLDDTPFGLHTVVKKTEDLPEGIIFILKNKTNAVNIKNQNQLRPFYMVYVSEKGQIVINHLQAKKMLDTIRLLSRGKTEPFTELCKGFNYETKDGKNMKKCSDLLGTAIKSIIETKDESDISLFLSGSQPTFTEKITGLDDFELICFFVVR